MKIALYIGDHKSDTLMVRLGWWVTRLVQKGPYGHVTHVEAVHEEHADGTVTIASTSVRDKGVRGKRVRLNPEHWLVVDVPQWDTNKSRDLLRATAGQPYDLWGAWATCMPGTPRSPHGFCNAWVGFPHIKASATFGPHHFAAICMSAGKDATTEFFSKRHADGGLGLPPHN